MKKLKTYGLGVLIPILGYALMLIVSAINQNEGQRTDVNASYYLAIIYAILFLSGVVAVCTKLIIETIKSKK